MSDSIGDSNDGGNLSLIGLRFEAERGRGVGIFLIVLGAMGVAGASVLTIAGYSAWFGVAFYALIGLSCLLQGGIKVRGAAKRVAEFEAVHGANAGKQDRIS